MSTYCRTRDIYNGEKLVYSDPAQNGDGYYHTERESYVRIEFKSPNTASSYWIVTLKNGTRMYFGYLDEDHTAATDGHIDAVGYSGKARVWALSKVMDVHGNYYFVEYHEDTTNGDYYPVRITYTKNGQYPLQAYWTVEFSYETRNDHCALYIPSKTDMDKRLKWITVKVGGNLLRKYHLDYEYGMATGRSRLIAVQEYGSDGNIPLVPWVDESYVATGKTLPFLSFIWQEGNIGTFTQAYASPSGIAGFDLLSTGDQVFSFDYNGDGKMDLCLYRPGSSLHYNEFQLFGSGYECQMQMD